MSDYPIKRQHSFKHHLKLGSIDPMIGLDVPSGTSPINSEMVEITPIYKSNLQEQSCLSYDQELNMKSQKWNKLITDKKSVMKIILNRYDEYTRREITLDSSYEDNLKVGEFFKFLARVRTVCNNTEEADIFFGFQVTKITKHHLHPQTLFTTNNDC